METQQVVVRSDLQGNEKPRFDIDRGRIQLEFLCRPLIDICRDQDFDITVHIPGGGSPTTTIVSRFG